MASERRIRRINISLARIRSEPTANAQIYSGRLLRYKETRFSSNPFFEYCDTLEQLFRIHDHHPSVTKFSHILLLLGVSFCFARASFAEDTAALSVLEKNCLECHGGKAN